MQTSKRLKNMDLTPNLIQRETGFFELQTHFEPPKSQKKNRWLMGKINVFWWRIDFLKNIWYTSSLNWCWMQNWAIYQIRWLGHIQHSPENGVGCLRWPFVWKCLVSDPIDLCITKSWLLATSTTFFRNIKMWEFLIFQISSRPPPSKIGRVENGVRLLNSQSFHFILNSETDLQYLIPQFFLCWCKSKIGHFTSQQILKIGNFWPIFHFQMQHFKCCQDVLGASN